MDSKTPSKQPNTSKQLNPKMAAVLDARQLVMRCVQLQKDLDQQIERNANQSASSVKLEQINERLSMFADYGQQELQRKNDESLSKLRAIVHYTGDQERLATVEQLFANRAASIDDVMHWQHIIDAEFKALYPTQPLSSAQQEQRDFPQQNELRVFQIKADS